MTRHITTKGRVYLALLKAGWTANAALKEASRLLRDSR